MNLAILRQPHRIQTLYILGQFGVPRSGLGGELATGFARHGTLKGMEVEDGVDGGRGRASYGKLVEMLRRLGDSLNEVRHGVSFCPPCVLFVRVKL